EETLNHLMSLGQTAWRALRVQLSAALAAGSPLKDTLQSSMVSQADVVMGLPATIGDYTDFYSSIHHATNIGRLFRPDNPLLPNYRWIPIGYHGRSSSIGVSPESFLRPHGQKRPGEDGVPGFGPSTRMDYEVELGVFVGKGNAQGSPISMDSSEDHVFGICILNDWSARDIQGWEYQPLGPFLGKSFASTISPWIVTMDALAPFRAPFVRPEGDPQPLEYLESAANRDAGAFDITLETLLESKKMRRDADGPTRLSLGNYKHAYWTVAQLVTHHTVNGCNLRPGDLLGTGTLSGPEAGMEGALIEITRGGKEPVTLPNGEVRSFLEDGDTVIMRAWCEAEGAVRIGFGEASGTVLPA
ncbi:MAG: fumarylacetoacetase, partial [Deltaproteobacteria bacterium]|nr:fumarylacetoacetase [Deltaproteobacteria bacterium]